MKMANGGPTSGITPDEMQKIEEMKKIILRNILTKGARERLNRIRLVKPDLALQLELYLVQLYQAGKLRGQMTDEQLKSILEMLSSGKKFKIIKK
jgi:programmed cell death protein 5